MEFKQRHLVRSVDSVKEAAIAIQAGINEDLEQRRRLLDSSGEQQRRWLATKIAQLYSFTPVSLHHVQWPVHAELERTTSPQIVRPVLLQQLNRGLTQAILNATELTHTISQATAAAAAAAAENLGNKTADFASTVSLKTQDLASTVSQTTTGVANTVRQKTADVVHRAEITTVNAADKVAKSASAVATVVIPKAQELVHDAAAAATYVVPKARELAHDAKVKIEHVAEDILESTTKAYVKALEEGERRRRKIDWEEQYAILNAFAVSGLIKDLGWEFYRQSDCVFLHNLRTLEEFERAWRLLPENAARDKINAKRIALLVDGKFSPVRASLPPAYVATKVEVVEHAELPPKAATAAF